MIWYYAKKNKYFSDGTYKFCNYSETFAQKHNYTGTWVLSQEKSKLESRPEGLTSSVFVIKQDGDEFSIDLVFYNRLLQCFVVFEILTTKLTHEDIGQLQMHVNYYDRYEKQDFENSTIGILLCADKNDAVVRIKLPESNKTIIASKYQLYLPTEQQLIDEVKKEIEKLDNERKELWCNTSLQLNI